MPNVFISYRRIDAAQDAGRLADALQRVLGQRPVFRDVESIAPGEVFAEEIDRRITTADVVIVLIGPQWLGELQRRQGLGETDFVHREVACALRLNKWVIPVLLREAKMPESHQLPGDLALLSTLHGLPLRDDKGWEAGLNQLIDAVGRPVNWRHLVARGIAAGTLAVLIAWLGLPLARPESGISEARVTILVVMTIWILTEWRLWYQRRGRWRERQ